MRNKTRTTLLALLVAAQALFIGGIAGSHYATGRWGQEIRIKTAPVDPRDMLYGDYVILNYEISRVSSSLWKSADPLPPRGKPVFVQLVGNGDLYEAAGVYPNKPAAAPNTVTLRARVEYATESEMRLTYGLEKYYVAENQGKPLEQKAGSLAAVVAVAPWGNAQLSRLEEVR